MAPAITFLLGSGISRPSGLPDVNEITQAVQSGRAPGGKKFYPHSGDYFLTPNPAADLREIEQILSFLSHLRALSASYFASTEPDRCVNYEDLAYLVTQVLEAEDQEFENPALLPLLNQLSAQFASGGSSGLTDLARKAEKYVRCVIWVLLSQPPSTLEHLSCLVDACGDGAIGRINICTLNHDIVLEKALAQRDIHPADGFVGIGNSDCTYFDPRA